MHGICSMRMLMRTSLGRTQQQMARPAPVVTAAAAYPGKRAVKPLPLAAGGARMGSPARVGVGG